MEDIKVSTSKLNKEPIDISGIYFKLKEKYRNVYMTQIGDQIFFYRSIGRKEFRTIVDDDEMNDFQKENVICDVCTLYPVNYDWSNCDAGIPSVLCEAIRKNSYIDSIETRQKLLGYYRSEMYDLDEQITCIINEAFPQYDIEEIEEWDVEKTTKYLSRAEWKLHHFRGLQFVQPEGDFANGQQEVEKTPASETSKTKNNANESTTNVSVWRSNKGKTKLTPDKIKEMEEFARKFPELNVMEDSGLEGVEGFEQEPSTIAPALRTPNMGGMDAGPQIDEKALAKMRANAKNKV